MRPKDLTEFVGANPPNCEGKILRKMIEKDNISSMIFWGPPGVGKTTLARIIAHETKSKFYNLFRRNLRNKRNQKSHGRSPK